MNEEILEILRNQKYPLTIPLRLPYFKRCGNRVKELVMGYECENCKSLLFGGAVEWREVGMFDVSA